MESASTATATISEPHSSMKTDIQEHEKALKGETASSKAVANGAVPKSGEIPDKAPLPGGPPRIKQDAYLGKYKFIRTIGKGNFAKVKLAKHVITGKEVAIKIIDKTQLNPSSLTKLFREVRIMKMLDHPNIVKLYEVIENEKILYLVMEYANGGEVFDYLVAHGKMKEKEARAKFRQIASAVQYCHAKHVVHRDLKAENLLLDSELNIKLADFGFANEFRQGTKLDTFCGSPPYAAPELFQGRKYDGPEVDVWSLGVILYTLVSGSLPFDGTTLRELRERVLRGKYRVPYYMSTECENLLKKMLIIAPSKRYSLNQILVDKWVNIGYENDILQPHVDVGRDLKDPIRIEILMNMGFTREEVEMSLNSDRFDNITATYHLLGERGTFRLASHVSSGTGSSANPPSSSSFNVQNESHPSRSSAIPRNGVANSPHLTQHTSRKPQGLGNEKDAGNLSSRTEDALREAFEKAQKLRNLQSTDPHYQNETHEKRPTRSHSTERTDSESWKQTPSIPIKPNEQLRSSERPGRNEATKLIDRLRHTIDSGGSGSGHHPQDLNPSQIPDGYSSKKPGSTYSGQVSTSGGQNGQQAGPYNRVPSPNMVPTNIVISSKRPQGNIYPNSPVAGIGGVLPLTPTMPQTGALMTSHSVRGGPEAHGARQSASSAVSGGRAGTLPSHTYSASGGRTMPHTDMRNRPHSAALPSNAKAKHGSTTPTSGQTKESPHSSPFFKEFGHFSFRHSKTTHVTLPQGQGSQNGSPTLGRQMKPSSTSQSLPGQASERESPGTDSTLPTTSTPASAISASEQSKSTPAAENPSSTSSTYEQGFSFLRSITSKLLLKRHSLNQRVRNSEGVSFSKSPTLHEESSNDNAAVLVKEHDNHAVEHPDEPNTDAAINHSESVPMTSPEIVISPALAAPEEETTHPLLHKNSSDPDILIKNVSNVHASSGQNLPDHHLSPSPLTKTPSGSGNSGVGSNPMKPRSLRFTMNMKTTSTLEATQMMPEIEKVLKDNQIQYTQRDRFLFVCQHGEPLPEHHEGDTQAVPAVNMQVRFEVEVCRLPLLSLNGVRLKRISGSSIVYKNIASKICGELKFSR